MGFLCKKKPLNFIIMSLWDWLLAAWIYEEIFDLPTNTVGRGLAPAVWNEQYPTHKSVGDGASTSRQDRIS